MVRSLAAVLGAALVVVWLTPRPEGDEVKVIDYAGPLAQARLSAPYDLYAPEGLPGGWRATSARSDRAASSGGVTWHLGFVTPSDRYAAVAQRPADPAATNAAAGAGRDEGTVTLAGASWQRRLRDDGERSLWRQDGQSVVAVTGSAPEEELSQLAVALRPG